VCYSVGLSALELGGAYFQMLALCDVLLS
jgi:hypothetical protein